MSALQGQLVGWIAPVLPAKPLDTTDTIAALVAEYSTTLYRVAFSVTRNAAEAEDAVQETFLRVLRHQSQIAEIRDLRVWLVRIVWNVVLDRKRRVKTRPENEDIDDHVRTLTSGGRAADAEVISSEQCAHILRLIDRLPHKEREALLLSAMQELSTVEIAAVLETTESSVRSRIFRARRELAIMLEKAGIPR
ncbi:RNA polymerase sigma factor [Paracidobacterium acidisoli]|uniref:RNA polymerase sigma factor n=1 Tax=Paracidobacterium acidisoli TaxID=2303751 RepID=A0A372IP06_9BACT|nr:RNA polymerase sigma factor [Paracidobacterium acidisoli]MBT9330969.1 RNA polymerase sigma factor [Paracidobacterium acidisoli]